jgi:hypothetical protein
MSNITSNNSIVFVQITFGIDIGVLAGIICVCELLHLIIYKILAALPAFLKTTLSNKLYQILHTKKVDPINGGTIFKQLKGTFKMAPFKIRMNCTNGEQIYLAFVNNCFKLFAERNILSSNCHRDRYTSVNLFN